MVDLGQYNADNMVEKACAQYCFGDLIQAELNQCRNQWNSHYIRKSSVTQCHGRPDYLYYFPKDNFEDQSFSYDQHDFDTLKQYVDDYNDDFEYESI